MWLLYFSGCHLLNAYLRNISKFIWNIIFNQEKNNIICIFELIGEDKEEFKLKLLEKSQIFLIWYSFGILTISLGSLIRFIYSWWHWKVYSKTYESLFHKKSQIRTFTRWYSTYKITQARVTRFEIQIKIFWSIIK